MQVLPSTAKDPNVNIPNIYTVENNIHAGIKYMRFIKDRYFDDELSRQTTKFTSHSPPTMLDRRTFAVCATLPPSMAMILISGFTMLS